MMRKIIVLLVFSIFLTSNCYAFFLDHKRWEFVGYGDHNIAFFFDKTNVERHGNDDNRIVKTWVCGADVDNKVYYYMLMSFFFESKKYKIEDSFCRKYETHDTVNVSNGLEVGRICNVYPDSIIEEVMYSADMYSW